MPRIVRREHVEWTLQDGSVICDNGCVELKNRYPHIEHGKGWRYPATFLAETPVAGLHSIRSPGREDLANVKTASWSEVRCLNTFGLALVV